MKKREIAEELLKNNRKHILEEYIRKFDVICKRKDIEEEYLKLDDCFSYLEKEGFDATGWELWEIPTDYSHVFINSTKNQSFDLAVVNIGEVEVRYIDENSNEKIASTIDEAIQKNTFLND